MKKTLIVLVSLFCFFLLGVVAVIPITIASEIKAKRKANWDKLVEMAKGEGKVMVYGRGSPRIRKGLTNAFKAKYGIDLEFLNIARGGELVAKVKKERSAGLYLPDVFIVGPAAVIMLKHAKALDPLEPLLTLPEVTDPKAWREGHYFIDKDRMIKPMRATYMRFITYNTDLVKEGELTSYRDLLDPKWKGKMVMGNPTGPSTAAAFHAFLVGIWGKEESTNFLKQLIKQEPVITEEIRTAVEWVARGKYAIGIGLRLESLPEFLRMGTPIALGKMAEGGQLGPGGGP